MNKKLLIIGGIVLLLLFGAVVWFARQSNSAKEEVLQSTLPQSASYEKIQEKINVSVERVKDNRRVNFVVSEVPAKYKTIEYEFSYKTASGGLQGGIGSPSTLKNGRYEKEILLGTCSAGGACTYDEGVKKIKFTIFFSTAAEKRYFEKEFDI
jgi:hypothetical protein